MTKRARRTAKATVVAEVANTEQAPAPVVEAANTEPAPAPVVEAEEDEMSETIDFPANAMRLERFGLRWPGQPTKYHVVRNGVVIGVLEAQADKTRPKLFGKHPLRYRVPNEEPWYPDLPSALRRIFAKLQETQ